MSIICLLPVVLSSLLLAAHFFRGGNLLLAGISLGIVVVLFVRRRWAAILVQLFLLLGALEWLRTLVAFVEVRQALEMPWVRLLFILGGVFVFTAATALLFETPILRRRYRAIGG